MGWPFAKKQQPEPQAHAAGVDVAKITTAQELEEFFRNGGSDTFAGEHVGVSQAMKVAAVNRCINILSDISSTAPIDIRNKSTYLARPQADDVVYMLNDMASMRVGSKMPARRLRKLMDVHKLLRGNGYARIVRGFRNLPVSLEFMHADRVSVRQLTDRSLEYRYATVDGRSFVLPQDEVLHVMGPSDDGVKGMSVLEDARNQIGFSIASEKHGSSLFKNNTSIGDILSNEKMLSKEAVEALKQSLEDYRGAENSGKTLILQGGMTHEKVGMTQADAEFVLSRKLGIIEICMFFGVPPHIAGFTENQTSYGQGVEHQGIAFVNFNVNGIYSGWEDAIRMALIESKDEFVQFDDGKLMRGDTKSRWESYKIARETGVYNANDILRAEGRPEREGGSEYWQQPNAMKGANDEPKKTPED